MCVGIDRHRILPTARLLKVPTNHLTTTCIWLHTQRRQSVEVIGQSQKKNKDKEEGEG